LGEQSGVLEKSGTWYLYKGERLGQGKENAKSFLKNSPSIAQEIESAIRSKMLGPNGTSEPDAAKKLEGSTKKAAK
jgi:recombination protein RecA